MLGKPPYYQETDALVTGPTVVKPYGEASPLTTLGIADHTPLQWIKTSAKGPVTAWRLDNLNEMDYAVDHRPRVKYNTPDAMPRYPFLGLKRLTRLGVENAVKQLLQVLSSYSRNARTWFCAG